MEITAVQFLLISYSKGILTKEEATAIAISGAVPDFLKNKFDAMPTQQQIITQIKLARMTKVERDEPLIELARQSLGWNSEQMDDLFIQAAQL